MLCSNATTGFASFTSMTGQRDYYEILGVTRESSTDEIKRAYRAIAIKHHPDRNPGDKHAEELFKEAAEAFAVLREPDRRRKYDRFGTREVDGRAVNQEFSFAEFAEIVEEFFGGVINPKATPLRKRGEHVTQRVDVSLEEISQGCEKDLTYNRYVPCEACDGGSRQDDDTSKAEACAACGGKGYTDSKRGFFKQKTACAACRGTGLRSDILCGECGSTGRVLRPHSVGVQIPQGAQPGSVQTLRSQGHHGLGGFGDLHVHLDVRPHALFRREGADVHYALNVTYPQLILGDSVSVPTLEGPVRLKIPARTQPGQALRLKGRGFKAMGGFGKGDQIVTLSLEIPQDISREQESLLKKLQKSFQSGAKPERHTQSTRLRT